MAKKKHNLSPEELLEQALVPESEWPYVVPGNWVWTRLGSITKVFGGGTPPSNVIEYYENGDIPWISPVDLSGYNELYIERGKKSITALGLSKSSARMMPKDTVLLSSRAPIGYVAIAANELTTNQGFKSFLPSPVYQPKYLYYYLKNSKELLESYASGTTFLELSGSKAEKVEFPLPPIAEQQRIVDRIESLFEKLDQAKGLIQDSLDSFENRKAAILHKAFSGELTKKWREENGVGMESWEETELGEQVSKLGDGLHGTPIYSEDGEFYFINGNNFNRTYIEIKADTKKVDLEEFMKYRKNIGENTVFVSINGTLGKTAFYNGEPVILGKSACYFNVGEKLDKRFIRYYMETKEFLNYASTMATGSTIKNLSLKAMRTLPLSLPTIEEQVEIINVLDGIIENELKSYELIALNHELDLMKKSILSRAFRGELGTNDQDEESSLALLTEVLNNG